MSCPGHRAGRRGRPGDRPCCPRHRPAHGGSERQTLERGTCYWTRGHPPPPESPTLLRLRAPEGDSGGLGGTSGEAGQCAACGVEGAGGVGPGPALRKGGNSGPGAAAPPAPRWPAPPRPTSLGWLPRGPPRLAGSPAPPWPAPPHGRAPLRVSLGLSSPRPQGSDLASDGLFCEQQLVSDHQDERDQAHRRRKLAGCSNLWPRPRD